MQSETTKAPRFEMFADRAYYDMYCVRRIGERRFGHGEHVGTYDEAIALVERLELEEDRADAKR